MAFIEGCAHVRGEGFHCTLKPSIMATIGGILWRGGFIPGDDFLISKVAAVHRVSSRQG